MFKEGLLDKILYKVKKLIPKSVFNFFAPLYHAGLAYAGAVIYGFPSRKMKVIGVTGTKGKSTTVFLIAKILENSGKKVAAIGSLGFKIKEREWPNTLKMTMPGRFKLQKFLREARKAGCKYVVLEVTSEGIKQKRHLGIKFDCAVFTNLNKEHIENHGSFENYRKAKEELFRLTPNNHVLNADDASVEHFSKYSADKKILFGIKGGDMKASCIVSGKMGVEFEIYGTMFKTKLFGEFNVYNCLAALSVGAVYGLDLPAMKPAIERIEEIPGRMQFVQKEPFAVVVDYAHTPDSLESVYKALSSPKPQRLICVLGAAGGGRDKWKRPEFGRIAKKYCDEIILTNEDPYDENPLSILKEIESGFSQLPITNYQLPNYEIILDRREAIKKAINNAETGDTVIITGKGSETSIAVSGGRRIPWSDAQIVRELIDAASR